MPKIAFVCVGNAGRSQMATAYAEAERARRGLEDEVEIVTGGTDPKESVHDAVREALREDGLDVGGRTPRRITTADVADAAYVVTMGCDADGFLPEGWDGHVETWDLVDPDGEGLDAVRQQREDVKRRVSAFFDRLEA